MLKLKPNSRELVLLLVLVALSIGVAWYYLLFTPLNNSWLSLKDQLNKGQQQLAERQELQLHDVETSELLQKLLREQTELQAQFDPISHPQDVIDFLVDLTSQTKSRVTNLEIKADQISTMILAPNYGSVRTVLEGLENSPNFVLVTTDIAMDAGLQGGFSLQLQAKTTWGAAQAGDLLTYDRTMPFGR